MVLTRCHVNALKRHGLLELVLEGSFRPLAKKCRRQNNTTPSEERHQWECPMNLDVLFLIAKYLHPTDLLNLTRTCKQFRQLLMHKSSAFVWKAARRQFDGFPNCPTDLTDAQYTILTFIPRCHGCAKPENTILWELRRRYCLDCKPKKLFQLSSCNHVIQKHRVVADASVVLEEGGESTPCVDKEQVESFMREYSRSSDKKQLIKDKKEQCAAIVMHANQCIDWEQEEAMRPQTNLFKNLHERDDSIIDRIEQHGFGREVAFFSSRNILQSLRPIFRTQRALTDKEWSQHQHQSLEIMNQFRAARLEKRVYLPRRRLLASKYANYVKCPPTNAPAVELLPHRIDLASLPPFQDILGAPEDTQLDDSVFQSAFARLPKFIGEWREKLDAGIAELVEIPSHLSPRDLLQPTANKLRLACALFRADGMGLFTYPEVLFASTTECNDSRDLQDDGRSVGERYRVGYIREAPYVVHACGMDPNVATPCDMDRLNVSLMCLSCNDHFIRYWRDAIAHAFHVHGQGGQNDLETVRWQVVTDEDACASILTSELVQGWYQCLLCLPRAGDAMSRDEITSHCELEHSMNEANVRLGIHFKPVGMALQAANRALGPMIW